MNIELELTAQQAKVLSELAEIKGLNFAETITQAIEESWQRANHEELVRASSARARDQYQGLFARLG